MAKVQHRLGYVERRALRMQRRVEKWEARLAGPPPPMHLHRALVSVLVMAAALAVAWLIAFGGH